MDQKNISGTLLPIKSIHPLSFFLSKINKMEHKALFSFTFHSTQWIVLSAAPAKTWFLRPSADKNTLNKLITEIENTHRNLETASDTQHLLPFQGGILGNIDYEFANNLNSHPIINPGSCSLHTPVFYAGLYLWAILKNPDDQASYLFIHPQCPEDLKQKLLSINWENDVLKSFQENSQTSFKLTANFKQSITRQRYQNQFNAIKDYIYAGDCYQVNLTQRFETTYKGEPLDAFQLMHIEVQTPFSAFLDTGNKQILSFSPERFLLIENGRVETKPIKGTRPRDKNPKKDTEFKQALYNSEKDRAENLMIVDLLRNDLGKFCETGSIEVPSLFAIESFHNVHHLVSTVTGRLNASVSPLRLLTESMPGGSITGAPKLRAMEIIAELESHPRKAYCGSMFMWSASGRLDSNIAIRTMVCEEGNIYCWGGGGIVADSQLEEEYQESIQKVSRLMTLLETTISEDQEGNN
jgi:para-aminobenzoate synthetase component 1